VSIAIIINFSSLTNTAQARLFGSPNHTISPFKAAIAAVHLILVPLAFIPNEAPVRYGARTDWWGCEHVSTSPIKEWVAHQAESALVETCDALYSEMKKAETASTDA
jgi:3-keto steroid reductase